MKLEIASFIALESHGDLEIYPDYSGRYMFGRETTGLTGTVDPATIVAELGDQVLSEAGVTRSEIAVELKSLRRDNLGRNYIWY